MSNRALDFVLALHNCFTSCTMNVISQGVIFVCQDIDFLPVNNIVEATIENVCDDLFHLCIFMSVSDTEEIIIISLSGDHNAMQYHWKIKHRTISHRARSGRGRGDCCF